MTTPRPRLTRGRTLDYAAGVYDFLQPFVLFGREKIYNRKIIDTLNIAPHHHVLDVGCGTGVLTALIGQSLDPTQGGHIIGIDAAPAMIDTARKKRSSSSVSFELAAAEKLPFPDASFDKACSALFFHHVDFELKVQAVRESFRILCPGGMLVVLDMDTPTTGWGRFLSRGAELFFHQPEIGENRHGLLRQAFLEGGMETAEILEQWQGYLTLFRLIKPS